MASTTSPRIIDAPPTTPSSPAFRAAPTTPDLAPYALTGLTVVLPCFNEAENVSDAIDAAVAAAQRCASEYEIVVVDDGSSDETSAIAAQRVAMDPHVRLLVHVNNRGYGEAVRTGIEAATMPWLLLTDADLQFDLLELEDLLPDALDADVVVGWRICRQDPWIRRANAAAWNALVSRVFDLPVRDVDCAFKLVRTNLVQGLALESRGAMVSTELLAKCTARGATVTEHGVHHRPRVAGTASGANVKVIARAFRELRQVRRSMRSFRTADPAR